MSCTCLYTWEIWFRGWPKSPPTSPPAALEGMEVCSILSTHQIASSRGKDVSCLCLPSHLTSLIALVRRPFQASLVCCPSRSGESASAAQHCSHECLALCFITGPPKSSRRRWRPGCPHSMSNWSLSPARGRAESLEYLGSSLLAPRLGPNCLQLPPSVPICPRPRELWAGPFVNLAPHLRLARGAICTCRCTSLADLTAVDHGRHAIHDLSTAPYRTVHHPRTCHRLIVRPFSSPSACRAVSFLLDSACHPFLVFSSPMLSDIDESRTNC